LRTVTMTGGARIRYRITFNAVRITSDPVTTMRDISYRMNSPILGVFLIFPSVYTGGCEDRWAGLSCWSKLLRRVNAPCVCLYPLEKVWQCASPSARSK